jgi:hypothetical protein
LETGSEVAQGEQLGYSTGDQGQDDSFPSAGSIWPLATVIVSILVLPALVHGVPVEVQVGLIVPAVLVAAVTIVGWVRDDLSTPARAGRQRLLMTPADPAAPYSPPVASDRSETDAALHLRTLQHIARLRFDYSGGERGDYKAFLNHPQKSIGVQMPGGSVAYPDIVVVQSPENFTKIVAEVETAETVNEDVAFYRWGPYAELAPLYLYVPVGMGDEALALCRRLDVPVVGIRTWRYIVGYDEIEINDVYTV